MNSSFGGNSALILGASSGHGAGVAKALARKGVDIFGVHFDLRSTLHKAQETVDEIRALGCEVSFFNVNAANPENRRNVIRQVRDRLPPGSCLRVFLHSLAFGTLRSYVPRDREDAVTQRQMEMTLDVMANTLVYWVQDLIYADLLGPGSKVFAMTSAGSHRILPTYGPTGAAKATLEYHVRHLAVELSSRGIAVNAIQAGVTDTPALRKIPRHELLLKYSREHNPGARITTPDDVARAVWSLADEDGAWMTGNIYRVDGGEDLVML